MPEILSLKPLQAELTQSGQPEALLLKYLKAFYDKMAKDIMIGFFFQGRDLNPIIEQQKNLLMMTMGFTQKYGGKPVSTAHLNLPPIHNGQFHRRMVILAESLRAEGLSEAAVQAWVAFEKSFENVVVK